MWWTDWEFVPRILVRSNRQVNDEGQLARQVPINAVSLTTPTVAKSFSFCFSPNSEKSVLARRCPVIRVQRTDLPQREYRFEQFSGTVSIPHSVLLHLGWSFGTFQTTCGCVREVAQMTHQPSKVILWAQDERRAVMLRDYVWVLYEQQKSILDEDRGICAVESVI